jgi:hypothetical protein
MMRKNREAVSCHVMLSRHESSTARRVASTFLFSVACQLPGESVELVLKISNTLVARAPRAGRNVLAGVSQASHSCILVAAVSAGTNAGAAD